MRRKLAVSLVFLVAVLSIMTVVWRPDRRFDLLRDYAKLTAPSNPTMRRLGAIPPTHMLLPDHGPDMVNIGYAAFPNVFGEMATITNVEGMLHIEAATCIVQFYSPQRYDLFAEALNTSVKRPASPRLGFKGGEPVVLRGETAREAEKVKGRVVSLILKDPYQFQRKVYETRPKPTRALVMMSHKALELYMYMLEYKSRAYTDSETFFFEGQSIRGCVHRIAGRPDIRSISIWDDNRKIEQVIFARGEQDVDCDTILQFLQGFRYTTEGLAGEEEMKRMLSGLYPEQKMSPEMLRMIRGD